MLDLINNKSKVFPYFFTSKAYCYKAGYWVCLLLSHCAVTNEPSNYILFHQLLSKSIWERGISRLYFIKTWPKLCSVSYTLF